MDVECLKLTAYFGERGRVDGRFLADVILDRCGEREIATSLLMRGAEGFGFKHHLRTDRLLTLSEDLPLVAVAVDERAKVEALLADLTAVEHGALLTLERARMLRGQIGEVTLPEELHEATKLTVYVGRGERVGRTPMFAAVVNLLYRRGIAGASVLLGVDGTAHGVRARARFVGRNADVPTMIVAVGEGERIAGVLPELGDLLRRPLMTVERVRVCKRDGDLLAPPQHLPSTDDRGRPLFQQLMVYTSERAMHAGRPVHEAIVRRLRATGSRGATVLRGVWGFHGESPPHGDRVWQLGRSVPVLTVIVDVPDGIARSFAVVDELTAEHGVVTSELVPALSGIEPDRPRPGLDLARHRF